MRRAFANSLYAAMQTDDRIWLITADLGYGLFDQIRKDFPDQFFNVGASEQAGMGVAVGLAMSNKIPFLYSITPFLLWRAAETIRNYINHESIPVKLIGSGRDDDYKHDGFSHNASDDEGLVKLWPNIIPLWPSDDTQIPAMMKDIIAIEKPFYLNLKR